MKLGSGKGQDFFFAMGLFAIPINLFHIFKIKHIIGLIKCPRANGNGRIFV
jgi:hypothetical protein